MRRCRRLALILLLAVVAASCGGSRPTTDAQATPELRSFGDPSQLGEGQTPGAEQPAGASPSGGSGGTSARGGRAKATQPPASATSAPAPSRSSDDGVTGSNAKLYLQGRVPKLIVEIGAVRGKEPLQGSLDFVRRTLERVLDKPGGIEFRVTATFPAQKSKYSIEDLIALERQHRTTQSTPEAASLYMLFVNGEPAWSSTSIGVAFSASTVAMFTDQIGGVATPAGPLSRERLERSTIVHEVGHILALVNLGYRSPRDHEDSGARGRNHSKNRDSVMYWAVEDVSVTAVFNGGPPDTFDADDLADLDDLKHNRL